MSKKITLLFILEVFAFILMIALLFLIVVQVLGRYLLDTLPAWCGEEATLLFLMWLCTTGSAIGAAKRTHLSIDSLVKAFPVKAQKAIQLIIHILIISFLGVMFIITLQLAWMNRQVTTPRLSIPMILVQGSLPFAMITMLYYEMKYLVKFLKRGGEVV